MGFKLGGKSGELFEQFVPAVFCYILGCILAQIKSCQLNYVQKIVYFKML